MNTTIKATFLSLLALSWVIPQTVKAMDATTITKEWSIDNDTVVYATHTDGAMLLAYPSTTGDGVYVYHYLPETEEWLDVQFLSNTIVDGADSAKVRDLAIITLAAVEDDSDDTEIFVVYWISEHYLQAEDGDNEFIEENYNLYRFYTSDDFTDSLSEIPNTSTQAGGSILHLQPAGGDTMYGFWNDDGDTVYAERWTAQDEWNESEPGSMAAVATTSEDFETTTANGNEYIFSDRSGDLKFGVLKTSCCDPVTFSSTDTIASDAALLDLTLDADDNIYILYKRYGDLRRKVLHTETNDLSDEIVVMDGVNPDTVTVTYNDYGEGQYIVLVSTFNDDTSTLRYSLENTFGWTKGETFFTKKKVIAEPQLRTFSTGHIQFVWAYNDVWYYTEYSPETKTWTENQKIAKRYGGRRLMNPLQKSGVRSTDDEYYIERLRTTSNGQKQQILRKWNLGTTLNGTPYYRLSTGYKRIYHAVTGDYHFIIVQKDANLKSIIVPEATLFGE